MLHPETWQSTPHIYGLAKANSERNSSLYLNRLKEIEKRSKRDQKEIEKRSKEIKRDQKEIVRDKNRSKEINNDGKSWNILTFLFNFNFFDLLIDFLPLN